MPVIRVLVVDDHSVVRQGLERLIESWDGIEVAGMAADAGSGVGEFLRLRPDVVLMDLGLGEDDGADVTRRILEIDPGARVLVLTSYPDRAHVEQALDAGAAGYLLKHASAREVESAIRAAARGETPLDPKVAHVLLRRSAPAGPPGLSEREREVLELVGEGLPNKRIAQRLGITERTVKGHLTTIYRQIGVTDRLQAALVARGGARDVPAEDAAER